MQAEPLKGRDGWNWLIAGWRIYRTQPVTIAVVVVSYLMLAALTTTLIPYVGSGILALATPGLSLGLATACRLVSRGLPVTPMVLFTGYRDDNRMYARPLIKLGLVYLVLIGLLSLLPAALGLFSMSEVINPTQTGNPESAKPMVMTLLWLGIGGIPIMMMFWFAPMLVAWHHYTPGKALFYSFFSVWRNRRAFIVYGMGWMMFAMGISAILGLLSVLLGLPGTVVNMIQMSLVFLVFSVTVCTYYPSYLSIFEPKDPDPVYHIDIQH